jgi:5-formyltetrahydrofolate cyclo-ligase
MLEHRRSLSEQEFRSTSLLIQRTFLETEEYRQARIVVVYASIHNEVDTEMVVQTALDSGKKVAFPAVVGHELIFRQVKTGSSMKSGAFGIMEPCPDCRVFMPDEVDVFLLPGIAFDLKGDRIGYGKGYYDKTLHRLEDKGKLVGLCYDFQLVDEIVAEPHDVKVDLIITEKRVVRPCTN